MLIALHIGVILFSFCIYLFFSYLHLYFVFFLYLFVFLIGEAPWVAMQAPQVQLLSNPPLCKSKYLCFLLCFCSRAVKKAVAATVPACPHVALHNVLWIVDIFKEGVVGDRLADLVLIWDAFQVRVVHSDNCYS